MTIGLATTFGWVTTLKTQLEEHIERIQAVQNVQSANNDMKLRMQLGLFLVIVSTLVVSMFLSWWVGGEIHKLVRREALSLTPDIKHTLFFVSRLASNACFASGVCGFCFVFYARNTWEGGLSSKKDALLIVLAVILLYLGFAPFLS